GFALIPDVVNPRKIEGGVGTKSGKFYYTGDRPERWLDEKGLHLHGYWFYDWADQRMFVDEIDTERKIISLHKPSTHSYGIRKNRRFAAFNALCEIDLPGEWVLDKEAGKIYFYPPGPVKGADIEISMLVGGMVQLDDVSHVTFKGLTFEQCRNHGLVTQGGSHLRIEDCVFRNMGSWALRIQNGTGHRVTG
ncbi:MAG: right-handed parallel beta-helix repeat-containing protein, partial [Lentisphaerae bacterium]|nr:right-handed parallel beta-helix repeat-containing protein [Lentisphaerota bacterium]